MTTLHLEQYYPVLCHENISCKDILLIYWNLFFIFMVK